MESIHLLWDLLLPSNWMVCLDLKGTYLTIPIFPLQRCVLNFQWRGDTFEFTTLPFGPSSAPWCSTKVMRPLVVTLRARGVCLILYLGDMLLMDQCPQTLLQHLQMTLSLLESFGFIINRQKSILAPFQSLVFLGFVVGLFRATLRLLTRKMIKIKHELRRLAARCSTSLRQIERVVGLRSSSIQAIFPGPLHYCALQRLKAFSLRRFSCTPKWSRCRKKL